MATEELFRVPPLVGAADVTGWRTETLRYRATARPQSKFKSVLQPKHLFGATGRNSTVTTRLHDDELRLDVTHELAGTVLTERLAAIVRHGRVRSTSLVRQLGPARDEGHVADDQSDADHERLARHERVRFHPEPLGLPEATYPEVMLPFLMRGQPLDGQRRAVWSWTNDRFMARVYYEVRRTVRVSVPAGTFEAALIWMYPDLNDWIAMGGVVTRLAKPLLPRYDIWIDTSPARRVVRFEGPYGPPGAPEIVLELAG